MEYLIERVMRAFAFGWFRKDNAEADEKVLKCGGEDGCGNYNRGKNVLVICSQLGERIGPISDPACLFFFRFQASERSHTHIPPGSENDRGGSGGGHACLRLITLAPSMLQLAGANW